MKQSDNAIHTSEDGSRLFIPCSCGDDADNIAFTSWDDKDDDDPIFIGVTIDGGDSWRYRLGAAWRALRSRPHRDSVGMSRPTVLALAKWLNEKVGA